MRDTVPQAADLQVDVGLAHGQSPARVHRDQVGVKKCDQHCPVFPNRLVEVRATGLNVVEAVPEAIERVCPARIDIGHESEFIDYKTKSDIGMAGVATRSVRLRYLPTSPRLLGRGGCTPRRLTPDMTVVRRRLTREGAVLQTTRSPPPSLEGFLLAAHPLLQRYHRHPPTRLETPDEILDRGIQSPLQLLKLLRVLLAVQRMMPDFIGRPVPEMPGLLHLHGFSPNVRSPGAVYLHVQMAKAECRIITSQPLPLAACRPKKTRGLSVRQYPRNMMPIPWVNNGRASQWLWVAWSVKAKTPVR